MTEYPKIINHNCNCKHNHNKYLYLKISKIKKLPLKLNILKRYDTHMSSLLMKDLEWQSFGERICNHEVCADVLNRYLSNLNTLLHN